MSNESLWTYRAIIVSVTDGDTVRVSLDLGFHCYHIESLRIAGIDTPELFSGTNREAGKAARDFVAAWVADAHLDRGTNDFVWPFIVHTQKDKQTFGRYIGSLIRADTGENLADVLVAAGMARRV